MSDWPEERTLLALLTLSGVSGQTIHDCEDYLAHTELIHEQWEGESHWIAVAKAEAEATGEDFDPDALNTEAHHLRRRLAQAVNAHWAQLCEIGAV